MRNSGNMAEKIIGIGKIEILFKEGSLTSIGLGSCIGLVLYDDDRKIAGMAHIMLPNSKESNFDQPNKTILLSEHDPELRKRIRCILERSEFTIAEEADEAFETVRKYDKLTMGIVMMSRFIPKIHAIETIKMIRDKDSASKVILLSPSIPSNEYLELLEQGANEVIIHPFNDEKVKGITNYVLFEKYLRFADIAVPVLASKLKNIGARKIAAKIVGGANIFPTIQLKNLGEIGNRNRDSVKEQLKQLDIPIISEDTGKNHGRTATFDLQTSALKVKTKEGEHII